MSEPRRISRRTVLKGAAAAGAGVTPLKQAGDRPYPNLVVGTNMIKEIKHIVVLMLENHSFDNHFGMLRRPGVDGFSLGAAGLPTNTNPSSTGSPVRAYHAPSTCQSGYNVSQVATAQHEEQR